MKSESTAHQLDRQDSAVYQSAAREAWQAAGSGEVLRLTVTSDSMRPLLRTGDVVVVESSNAAALRPGAVIVVQRGAEWVTHRLVMVDEHGWHTHGDNTRSIDEAVSADEIIGRVIAIERGALTIDLQQARWAAVERRINRLQRGQIRLFLIWQRWNGSQSNRLTRAAAAVINWPFQVALHAMLRTKV